MVFFICKTQQLEEKLLIYMLKKEENDYFHGKFSFFQKPVKATIKFNTLNWLKTLRQQSKTSTCQILKLCVRWEDIT
jgi:hypothetical protein